MATYVTCSWCHTENSTGRPYCSACGHQVGRSRLTCQCHACRSRRQASAEAAKRKPAGEPGSN